MKYRSKTFCRTLLVDRLSQEPIGFTEQLNCENSFNVIKGTLIVRVVSLRDRGMYIGMYVVIPLKCLKNLVLNRLGMFII